MLSQYTMDNSAAHIILTHSYCQTIGYSKVISIPKPIISQSFILFNYTDRHSCYFDRFISKSADSAYCRHRLIDSPMNWGQTVRKQCDSNCSSVVCRTETICVIGMSNCSTFLRLYAAISYLSASVMLLHHGYRILALCFCLSPRHAICEKY